MPHSPNTRVRPRLLAAMLAFALALALVGTASAAAEVTGQLKRFGPTAGAVEKGPGKGKLVPERTRLIGVDSEEENDVFVLEEPKEVKYIEVKGVELAKRTFRVQKFSGKTGAFLAESQIFEVTTSEEGPAIGENEVEGIAVDPGEGRLYFLVDAGGLEGESYESSPAAAYLFALSTSSLAPAPGTTEGVLAGPKQLADEPREAGKTLLEPKGLTVDPLTHEVIVLAHTDAVAGEEDDLVSSNDHYVLQRISNKGVLGQKYVDTKDFFKRSSTKEPWSGSFSPFSPVATASKQIFVSFDGIAQIPYEFEKATQEGAAPTQLAEEPSFESSVNRLIEPIEYEYEEGGASALAASPEGTLYSVIELENQAEHEITHSNSFNQAIFARSASTGAPIGWTGGQSGAIASKNEDQCVIQALATEEPLPAVAAGSGGDVFVLAPQFLSTEEELPTHSAIIEFGPGGKGCPTASAGKVAVKVNGVEVPEGESVSSSNTLRLSTPLKQADAISSTWTIENLQTKATVEEPVKQEQFGEAVFSTKLAGGEYKILAKVHSDDLQSAEIIETPVRTLKVEGPKAECPVVEAQPKDASSPSGGTAKFTSSAKGNPLPTVSWEVSTDEGKEWKKDEADKGRHETTLSVEHVKASQNGYEYRAAFDNGCEVKSEHATLTVTSEAPKVTQSPQSVTVAEGLAATFTAAAAGAPTPTVQWEAAPPGSSSFAPIPGATTASYTVALTSVSQSGTRYRATFTGEPGQTASTEAATLTVTPFVEEKPGGGGGVEHEIKVAPKAAIAGTTFKVTPAGAFTIQVSCPTGATSCIGAVVVKTLTAVSAAKTAKKHKKAILTLASGSFSIAGGQSKKLTLHLTSKGRTLLAHAHTLRARATASSHDPQGEQVTTLAVLTLKAPKKKH